jgi:hypothetical protein
MRGVVACEALYPLVERFAPQAPVRYLPAELHEFPVNVPVDTAIGDRVQSAVDDLDHPALEAIAVSYATSGAGLSGISSQHVPLLVSKADDCTATVLPHDERDAGENKAAGTFYLTRGWIDCGVDSYKLYKAYRGEIGDLVDRFEAAREADPALRVSWPDGDRFHRARQITPGSTGTLDRFFHSVVQYYDRVTIVDTGDLHPIHHDYAEAVRSFIERLRNEFGSGERVELSSIDGRTDRIEALLNGSIEGSSVATVLSPGEQYSG